MVTNTGKSDYNGAEHSKNSSKHSQKDTSKNQVKNSDTNAKKVIFTNLMTQLKFWECETENSEITKEEFWLRLSYRMIVELFVSSINEGVAERPGWQSTYMKQVGLSTLHRLSAQAKELSNTWPVDIEESLLLSLTYQGVLAGLTNFMWQWKPSRMDWFTIHGTIAPLETYEE